MNKISTLKLNVLYNILYQILAFIVPLITAPYISRVIGKDGMGIYSYSFAIAHYFVIFIMLGILNYGNREISLVRSDIEKRTKLFWNIYIVQFVMGVVLFTLYVLYVIFYCNEYKLVFLFQSFYVLSGIIDISWFYFGIEKYKITTGISSINKILTTLFIFLFVNEMNDFSIYTLLISIASLLNNVIYWIYLPKYINKINYRDLNVLPHIKPIVILFLPVIAINVYRYISKIMLGCMSEISEVGIYDAAEKFINVPLSIIAAVGTVMLSRISSLAANNDNECISRYNHISMVIVMAIGLGVVFGLASISEDFIPYFYGEVFSSSSTVLLILLPSVLMISWSNVLRNQYLLPNRKDSIYCYSVFAGAIANVIVNLLTIPQYGAIGAAIGTLSAEIVVCLIQSIFSYRAMQFQVYLKDILPFVFIGIIMFALVNNINVYSILLNLILKIAIGSLFYLSFSWLIFKKKLIYNK